MRLTRISLILVAAALVFSGPNRGVGAETSRAPSSATITVPTGTRLPIRLDSSIGSDISRAEQPVHAHLSSAVTVRGQQVLAPGSRVNGVVTRAVRSGRVKGRARISVRFDTLVPRGDDERYSIRTAAVSLIAPATTKRDALEIGGGAAGGALVGSLLGGKKGALIGSAAGGGAGTGVVLLTRGKEVRLVKGAALVLRLREPVTIRVAS
ncbi:MAG: hypothetical protein C5B57_00295 [Blastocatellia bacterium]|nr:MAG: hypothetical protein C5B57_00295 [Blastocatellia bacterium]